LWIFHPFFQMSLSFDSKSEPQELREIDFKFYDENAAQSRFPTLLKFPSGFRVPTPPVLIKKSGAKEKPVVHMPGTPASIRALARNLQEGFPGNSIFLGAWSRAIVESGIALVPDVMIELEKQTRQILVGDSAGNAGEEMSRFQEVLERLSAQEREAPRAPVENKAALVLDQRDLKILESLGGESGELYAAVYLELNRLYQKHKSRMDHPAERNRLLSDSKSAEELHFAEDFKVVSELLGQIKAWDDLMAEYQSSEHELGEYVALQTRVKQILELAIKKMRDIEFEATDSVIVEIHFPATKRDGRYEEQIEIGRSIEAIYNKLCQQNKWSMVKIDARTLHGYPSIDVYQIVGRGAGRGFIREAGAHLVKFEHRGMHYENTVRITVLEESDPLISEFPDKDFEVTPIRSQGPGGQNVNKVSSAAQITHLPTGKTIKMQESRSLQDNIRHGKSVLRLRLVEDLARDRADQVNATRRNQLGVHRNDHKVRTYDRLRGGGIARDERTKIEVPIEELDSVDTFMRLWRTQERVELTKILQNRSRATVISNSVTMGSGK